MPTPTPPRTAAVLVLGDVGRSPRMQYHALSLAESCAEVRLVGYAGERCVPSVEASPRIRTVLMRPDVLARPSSRLLLVLYLPLKALLQLGQLLWTLLVVLPQSDVLLVQTPPAIPALLAAWAVRMLRRTVVVLDWHNLAYTVLQDGLRKGHPFVPLAKAYEEFFAGRFDGHLCVTAAMQAWLRDKWGVDARVLHDRPPAFFAPLPPPQRHDLLRRLAPLFVSAHDGAHLWGDPAAADGVGPWAGGATPWTTADGRPRDGRPALLVSSTSWSADEDFGMLLEALTALDGELAKAETAAADAAPALRVVAVVTGKGPLKAAYEARMRTMALRHVAVCTMWLDPADYPRLLGAADLGVCLHTSTSGLDLPMKVLDMYGCGLPVCAVGFDCLSELVVDGANGLVFDSAAALADQLHSLLAPTKAAAAALEKLRAGVAASEAERPRWAENWRAAAAPLLLEPPPPGAWFHKRPLYPVMAVVIWFVVVFVLGSDEPVPASKDPRADERARVRQALANSR